MWALPTPYRVHFQLRDLPSAIHSMAVCRRRARVSALFASPIHSRYSRLWLGLKPANVACAFLLLFSAASRSAGTRSTFGDARFVTRGTFTPSSFSATAFLM